MWTRCPLELIDETWEIENEQDGVCLPKYHSHELLESGENVTNQRESLTRWSEGIRLLKNMSNEARVFATVTMHLSVETIQISD